MKLAGYCLLYINFVLFSCCWQVELKCFSYLYKDAEGRTPIHVAISNQHSIIIQLLISHPDIRLNVRDRQGLTPFACAMTYKNNKAAESILKREPGAAEQARAQNQHYTTAFIQAIYFWERNGFGIVQCGSCTGLKSELLTVRSKIGEVISNYYLVNLLIAQANWVIIVHQVHCVSLGQCNCIELFLSTL